MKTESEDYECSIRDPILETDEMRKLFVGGISSDANNDELKKFFEEKSGGVVSECVIIKKDGERKRHFGFVTFEKSESLDEVISKRSELAFHGTNLDVNRAVPKNNTTPGAHEKTKKLFIANLPKNNCTEDDLRKYFEQRHPKKYGTIESIQLIKKKDDQGNKTVENKGYGFVMVSSEDMADKMAIQHQHFEFGGRKIELKKSVPTTPGPDESPRGRGRGSSSRGGRGGRGGNAGQFSQAPAYGGGYGGGYGGNTAGYDSYYGYDGDYGYGGGYGGGYAPPPPRGSGRGRGRFQPY